MSGVGRKLAVGSSHFTSSTKGEKRRVAVVSMQIQTFQAGHVPNLLAIRFLPISPTLKIAIFTDRIFVALQRDLHANDFALCEEYTYEIPSGQRDPPSLKAGTSPPAYFGKTRYLLVSSDERSL